MNQLILGSGVVAIVGLVIAIWLAYQTKKINVSNEKAKEISTYIHEGAMAYLSKQYRILAVYIVVVTLLICFIDLLNKFV